MLTYHVTYVWLERAIGEQVDEKYRANLEPQFAILREANAELGGGTLRLRGTWPSENASAHALFKI